jgi:hypothetical protein
MTVSDSRSVVQFAELIRQAVERRSPQGMDVITWLGDQETVAHGAMPAALIENECPECGQEQPHLVQSLGNWDQYICLACGQRHSYQLTKARR